MRFQDFIIGVTQHAADEAFRYAAAVPADKLEWKPLDEGRTVLDQAREMAKCPDWAYALVAGEEMGNFDEEAQAKLKVELDAWKDIDTCKAECQKRLDRLFELYRTFPDEKLTETKWLPYGGGRDFSMTEIMGYPHWNYNYHTGQIAYIQTLYGDKGMY